MKEIFMALIADFHKTISDYNFSFMGENSYKTWENSRFRVHLHGDTVTGSFSLEEKDEDGLGDEWEFDFHSREGVAGLSHIRL